MRSTYTRKGETYPLVAVEDMNAGPYASAIDTVPGAVAIIARAV